MAITPTGGPAWTRVASHDLYGGNVNKTNFHSQGVTNALTDVGAEAFVRACADLAAAVRTAAFCKLTVTCQDSSPAAPLIEAVHQMTGIRLASYVGDVAPTGFPSAARNGNGDVTITWASTYTDPYGVSGAIVIRHALASSITSGGPAVACNPEILAGNLSVRVRNRFFPGGTDQSNARFTLEVS